MARYASGIMANTSIQFLDMNCLLFFTFFNLKNVRRIIKKETIKSNLTMSKIDGLKFKMKSRVSNIKIKMLKTMEISNNPLKINLKFLCILSLTHLIYGFNFLAFGIKILVINPKISMIVSVLNVCFIAELIVDSTIWVACGTNSEGICGGCVCIFST